VRGYAGCEVLAIAGVESTRLLEAA